VLDWLVVDGLVWSVIYLLLFKLFHSSEKANKKQNNKSAAQTHTINQNRTNARSKGR
jgi:hypothetical protein